MGFPERLKTVIDKAGLSHKAFYERMSVSKSQFFNYLGGRSEPTLSFFQRLTTEFPWVDLEWLTTGSATSCTAVSTDRETRIINKMLEGMTDDQKADVRKYCEMSECWTEKNAVKKRN